MRALRGSIASVCIAFLIGACSSGESGGSGAGGSVAAAGTGGHANVAGAGGGNTPGGLGGGAPSGLGGSTPSGLGGSDPTGVGGQIANGGSGGSPGVGGSPGQGGSSPAGTGGGGPAGAGPGGSGPAGAGGSTPPPAEPKLITSANNAFWKTGTLTEVTSGTADVTVNDSSALQDWNGMGGTFNEQGWNVLSMLSASDRDHAMKLLFDATDGARFQYGRLPIGASDYAMSRYTLDDTTSPDPNMDSFSIERDKDKLIPYIQAALAINPNIHLWASPWTPPPWMKQGPFQYTNGAMNYDGGHMKEDAATFQAFALYLARFVEEYAKIGIKIEAVHPQNEPGYETRYPSCLWTAAGFKTFIGTYLGPTFMSRSVPASIYLGTMSNNDAAADPAIISAVTGDATAMKFVKGFGLQWNMIDSVGSLKSKNLPLVQSEHKCGNYPWNPSGFPAFNANMPANDYAYGVESWGYIRDWIKAGVNVYSAWNMVLDTAGKNLDSMRPWPQNALLVVNTSSKTLTATPAYYVFRHVSQYVDPGAKVVSTTAGSGIDALGFKNPDGTIVAVIYNSGAAKSTFTVQIAGKKEQFSMPSNGWATVNWK